MCRFLIARSNKGELGQKELFDIFSNLAKNNPAPDGDKQEDGWGVAYKIESEWEILRSINPIWKDKDFAKKIPSSKFFIFHARSATFEKQKGLLYLNQPYFSNGAVFVFNGAISKVSLKINPYGDVGARKIFSMILAFKESFGSWNEAIYETYRTIEENSERIKGFNIGLVVDERIFVFNYFTQDEDYYQLWRGEYKGALIISSNKFSQGKSWGKLPVGQVVELKQF